MYRDVGVPGSPSNAPVAARNIAVTAGENAYTSSSAIRLDGVHVLRTSDIVAGTGITTASVSNGRGVRITGATAAEIGAITTQTLGVQTGHPLQWEFTAPNLADIGTTGGTHNVWTPLTFDGSLYATEDDQGSLGEFISPTPPPTISAPTPIPDNPYLMRCPVFDRIAYYDEMAGEDWQNIGLSAPSYPDSFLTIQTTRDEYPAESSMETPPLTEVEENWYEFTTVGLYMDNRNNLYGPHFDIIGDAMSYIRGGGLTITGPMAASGLVSGTRFVGSGSGGNSSFGSGIDVTGAIVASGSLTGLSLITGSGAFSASVTIGNHTWPSPQVESLHVENSVLAVNDGHFGDAVYVGDPAGNITGSVIANSHLRSYGHTTIDPDNNFRYGTLGSLNIRSNGLLSDNLMRNYTDTNGVYFDSVVGLFAGGWPTQQPAKPQFNFLKSLYVTGQLGASADIYTSASVFATNDVQATDDLIALDDGSIGDDLVVTDQITGADLNSTDDLVVGDDATITGDLAVTGASSMTGLRRTVTTKTGDYTATLNDWMMLCDTSINSFTITLPAAATCTGIEYYFQYSNGADSTIIDANGAETFTGPAAYPTFTTAATELPLVAIGDWCHIVSTGTEWRIIYGNMSSM